MLLCRSTIDNRKSQTSPKLLRQLQCILLFLTVSTFARAQDWPQLQHDPARTGGSEMDLAGTSFRIKWAWFGDVTATKREDFPKRRTEGFENITQPIVADGKVFIGTLTGHFYAIDAKTGRNLWRVDTALPILHTAAYADGRVFFPGMDLAVHAHDAASGKELWKGSADAGFSTAVLIAGNTVIAASRDGIIHAWDPASGAVKWTFACDAPIYNSPASDGKRIFIASEDMVAHAINLADGTEAWKATLIGQSARNYFPVIADGVVFFRTMFMYHSDMAFGEVDRLFRDAPQWPQQREALLKYLTENPTRQTMFALDAETGKSKYMIPMGLVCGENDTPKPPTVTHDGQVWSIWRARGGWLKGGTFAMNYTPQIDRLDLKTGDRIPGEGKGTTQGMEGDNEFMLSAAGGYILAKNTFRGTFALDRRTGESFGILHNYDEGYSLPGRPIVLYGKPGSGVPGPDGGDGRSAIAVAEGCLFMNFGALVAIEAVKGEGK